MYGLAPPKTWFHGSLGLARRGAGLRLAITGSLLLFAPGLTFGGEPRPAEAPPHRLAAAVELFRAKKYPEARVALAEIVAADPGNAAANYYLGRTLELRGDVDALGDAVKYLQRASTLEPANPTYLGRYGGASLLLAERTRSPGAARRGRDAMEKALQLDPGDLDAREGLIQFYLRAPWPLGSSARAAAHLDALRQRDPARATVLGVLNRLQARDYAAAFRLCDAALAQNPEDYNALYQYGRTAIASGRNLTQGLAALKRCLALTPPSPAAPSASEVWLQLGRLHEKMGQPAEARAAYESCVRLDQGNREASGALARLGP